MAGCVSVIVAAPRQQVECASCGDLCTFLAYKPCSPNPGRDAMRFTNVKTRGHRMYSQLCLH